MSDLIIKECPECGGNGEFIEDYYDPTNFYGHGQRTYRCDRCVGTGQIEEEVTDEENE